MYHLNIPEILHTFVIMPYLYLPNLVIKKWEVSICKIIIHTVWIELNRWIVTICQIRMVEQRHSEQSYSWHIFYLTELTVSLCWIWEKNVSKVCCVFLESISCNNSKMVCLKILALGISELTLLNGPKKCEKLNLRS